MATEEISGMYVSDSEASTHSDNNFRIEVSTVAAAAAAVQESSKANLNSNSNSKQSTQPTKWKEEDAIILLESLIQFHQENGGGPNAKNKKAYYDFIKSRLWEGVTTHQIYEKLRTLKKNFDKMKKKLEIMTGKQQLGLVVEPYHHNKVFQLSTKIWDTNTTMLSITENEEETGHVPPQHHDNSGEEETGRVPQHDNSGGEETGHVPQHDNSVEEETGHVPLQNDNSGEEDEMGRVPENDDNSEDVIEKFWDRYPYLYHSVDESNYAVRDHLYLLGDEMGEELDWEWRCLNLESEELWLQMSDLEYNQANLILSAITSDHK